VPFQWHKAGVTEIKKARSFNQAETRTNNGIISFTAKIINSMAKQIFNVIIFFHSETGRIPAKYRNVSNPESLANKARKWGGWYMNLYKVENKAYSHRIYL
jgi:hypothetical protein